METCPVSIEPVHMGFYDVLKCAVYTIGPSYRYEFALTIPIWTFPCEYFVEGVFESKLVFYFCKDGVNILIDCARSQSDIRKELF